MAFATSNNGVFDLVRVSPLVPNLLSKICSSNVRPVFTFIPFDEPDFETSDNQMSCPPINPHVEDRLREQIDLLGGIVTYYPEANWTFNIPIALLTSDESFNKHAAKTWQENEQKEGRYRDIFHPDFFGDIIANPGPDIEHCNIDLNRYRLRNIPSLFETYDANKILRRETKWPDFPRLPLGSMSLNTSGSVASTTSVTDNPKSGATEHGFKSPNKQSSEAVVMNSSSRTEDEATTSKDNNLNLPHLSVTVTRLPPTSLPTLSSRGQESSDRPLTPRKRSSQKQNHSDSRSRSPQQGPSRSRQVSRSGQESSGRLSLTPGKSSSQKQNSSDSRSRSPQQSPSRSRQVPTEVVSRTGQQSSGRPPLTPGKSSSQKQNSSDSRSRSPQQGASRSRQVSRSGQESSGRPPLTPGKSSSQKQNSSDSRSRSPQQSPSFPAQWDPKLGIHVT